MYSAETAAEIDRVVREIIEDAHNQCRDIVKKHRALLDVLAERLLEQETLVFEENQEIYNEYQSKQGRKRKTKADSEKAS